MRTEIQIRDKVQLLQEQVEQLKGEHGTMVNEVAKKGADHNAAISHFYQRRISTITDKIAMLNWVLGEDSNEQLMT